MSVKEKIASFGRPLTVPELAEALGMKADTIYRHAKKGTIPNFRLGMSVRFEPRALCEWFDKQ